MSIGTIAPPNQNIYRGILGEEQQTPLIPEGAPSLTGQEALENFQTEVLDDLVDEYPVTEITPITFEDEEYVRKEIRRWYTMDTQDTYRNDFLKDLTKFHQAYLGYMTPTSFPWENCSNLDLGLIEMAVDNIKSRFKMSTVGERPMFACIGKNEVSEGMKDQIEDLMSGALDQQVEIEHEADYICQDTIELGNSVVKRRWSRERKQAKAFERQEVPIRFKTPFLNLLSKNVPQVKIVEKEIIDEKVVVERIPLEDWIFPAGTREFDPQKMHHVMHRFRISKNKLEEMFADDPSYDSTKLSELQKWFTDQDNQTQKATKARSGKTVVTTPEPTLECVEVYCQWKHQGSSRAEEVIITWAIQADIIIRKVRLIDVYFDGKRPFRWFRYKNSGQPYGRGVVEMLYPYREALNNIFNMSVNSMMLQILPWGFYRYSSSFTPEEHRLAPGVWIPLDDINDARPTQFAPTATMADGAIALIINLVERQSGISAPHTGQTESGRKTAFEIRAVLSEGNIKHQERIEGFQSVFGELLRDIYLLYKFNLPDNAVFRKLYDSYGRKMKKPIFFTAPSRYQMASLDYDFVILGSMTTGNKAIERQDSLELAQTLLGFPIVAENPAAQIELAKDIVSVYGKRDPERFLPPDEVTQFIKQMKLKELVEIFLGQRDPGAGTPRRQVRKAA